MKYIIANLFVNISHTRRVIIYHISAMITSNHSNHRYHLVQVEKMTHRGTTDKKALITTQSWDENDNWKIGKWKVYSIMFHINIMVSVYHFHVCQSILNCNFFEVGVGSRNINKTQPSKVKYRYLLTIRSESYSLFSQDQRFRL